MSPETLRAEALVCRETASGPCGEYGNAFWVAAIVLENLAKRLDDALLQQEGGER